MWKTAYNSKPSPGQIVKGESQTIQGQTLSIAEMLKRLQNGQPVTLRTLEYGGDEIPQPRIKDLTDIDDIRSYIAATENKVSEYKKAAAKQAEKEANEKLESKAKGEQNEA